MSTVISRAYGVTVEELTIEEGRELFDRVCREELGVPYWEFLERYPDDLPLSWSHDSIVRLEILLPFCRGAA